MCGISGIFNLSIPKTDLKKYIRKMGSAQYHRGPDEWGEMISEFIAFGHNRLTILDDKGGKQPMTINNVSIIFNGEIYNNIQIRESLAKEGIKFTSTHSDTESILRAYLKWGTNAFQKLDGMFSFAILDSRVGKFYLARDFIGIKPLYYFSKDDGLIFSSEIKGIIASGLYKPSINKEQLPNFFFNRSVYGSQTLFENIYKLPPGKFITYDMQKCNFHISSFVPDSFCEIRNNQNLEHLLKSEVNSHLQADCEVSVALSGGIDSSLIAYYSSLNSSKISTFNIKTESVFDESKYAEKIVKHIKSNHYSLLLDNKKMIKYFENWSLYNDDPVGDPSSLALYYMNKEVNKNGFKVLLSGEGADELFVGYNSYIRYFIFRLLGLLPFSNIAVKLLAKILNDFRLLDYFLMSKKLKRPYFLGTSHSISIENLSNLFIDSKKSVKNIFDFIKENQINPKSIYSSLFYDQEFRLPYDLLLRADKASMANSVEIRVPFLSSKLIAFSRKNAFYKLFSFLPMLNKIKLKFISAKFFGFLFSFRKKNGFELPVDKWIKFLDQKFLKVFFKEALFCKIINYSYLYKSLYSPIHQKKCIPLIWNWIVLEIWYRNWILDYSKSLENISNKIPNDYFDSKLNN
ncbi:asparagine synthase (glutamine-hydrolyzing) [uncultured Prochlorococcus sp.]|uniref:asparagine synthase (glutamine-hydrolyzing) n=1 Tax=uncultured Prochlorococcus sp. TaxID=159733 RepID=UPI002589EE8C|nr:asparagine synthase (glutamine-hydrolyzing) [uncultured Prochlorococcus sp.]